MSVTNSSTGGGTGGSGFSLGSGAATGVGAGGMGAGIAHMTGQQALMYVLLAVTVIFMVAMAWQAAMRVYRRRQGAR